MPQASVLGREGTGTPGDKSSDTSQGPQAQALRAGESTPPFTAGKPGAVAEGA